MSVDTGAVSCCRVQAAKLADTLLHLVTILVV